MKHRFTKTYRNGILFVAMPDGSEMPHSRGHVKWEKLTQPQQQEAKKLYESQTATNLPIEKLKWAVCSDGLVSSIDWLAVAKTRKAS